MCLWYDTEPYLALLQNRVCEPHDRWMSLSENFNCQHYNWGALEKPCYYCQYFSVKDLDSLKLVQSMAVLQTQK